MTFLASLNVAADEVLSAFWHSVSVLAEEESLPEPDAFAHLRQAVQARIKAVKLTHGVDYVPDGRAARWRVRVSIYRGEAEQGNLHADSEGDAPLSRPGSVLIHGLPAVAAWVWEMIEQAHAGATVEELSLATVKHKLRTLRVALSKQGGECAWRLRYSVAEPARAGTFLKLPAALAAQRAAAGTLDAVMTRREPIAYLAQVRVSREEPANRVTTPLRA